MGRVGAFTGVEVVAGDSGGEVAVTARVTGEDGQVGAVGEGELGTVDGGQAHLAAGGGVADDPGQAVVVGEGERLETELGGGAGEVLGIVGAVEEGVGRVRVELGVAVRGGHVRSVEGSRGGVGRAGDPPRGTSEGGRKPMTGPGPTASTSSRSGLPGAHGSVREAG